MTKPKWKIARNWRIAKQRLAERTRELSCLADWRESLERRLALAAELVADGLPDPHFDCLEAEVIEFQNRCQRLIKKRAPH